jgi:hypothetical protein
VKEKERGKGAGFLVINSVYFLVITPNAKRKEKHFKMYHVSLVKFPNL